MKPVKKMQTFEDVIVGESPQIKKVIRSVKKIARSSTITTLIYGESGTGKELVARLIHNLSTFSHQPFVDINCGAIPETLLESELFGYEKGAFTGAQVRKPGLFELAEGGTIFLDEIGNTSTNFQVKLLKAVENKRFRRIGGVQEINISTRIIAATNVDLLKAVKLGKFREDLYYRLNVCQIMVPPLRERGKDVLLLANHFIERFNKEYQRNVKGLAPETETLILNYHWPGNVRQLKNAIERAVLIEGNEWIKPEDLGIHSERDRSSERSGKKVLSVNGGFTEFEIPDEGISLEKIERDLLLSALKKANGNLSYAARLLKINRGKLRYRLEKLGITNKEIYMAIHSEN
ncbi:MAG: sigma-54-dependent Fis family transcriptional regulator [Calditrichaeota bacterium]|nr:MAG: sigma-54-dependent Fis family transcriptional regulator [Calditrichota bacterium]